MRERVKDAIAENGGSKAAPTPSASPSASPGQKKKTKKASPSPSASPKSDPLNDTCAFDPEKAATATKPTG